MAPKNPERMPHILDEIDTASLSAEKERDSLDRKISGEIDPLSELRAETEKQTGSLLQWMNEKPDLSLTKLAEETRKKFSAQKLRRVDTGMVG